MDEVGGHGRLVGAFGPGGWLGIGLDFALLAAVVVGTPGEEVLPFLRLSSPSLG